MEQKIEEIRKQFVVNERNKKVAVQIDIDTFNKIMDQLSNTQKIPISQKIVRNTIFNTIGYSWQMLIGLILTPYIVGCIGMERYGILAIVGVLTGYFGLLDFGVKDSFTKYIAEFYAKEDHKSINELVNVGLVFYSLLALVIIAIGYFFLDPLIRLFKIPDNLYDEAFFVFLLGIIIFAASNVVNVFAAIQSGLQRMDISNKVAVAISFPNAIGTVVFLQLGYGLPGLIVSNVIITGIRGIVHILIAFKILPTFRFNPFMFNRRIFNMLFGFGVKRWVTQIEYTVTYQTDKLLISHFLNVSLVGYYELGSIIINRAREMLLILTSAIVPAASELDANGDQKQLVDLYLRGVKYIAMASVPVMLFLLVMAHPIMLIWMGVGYKKSELVIQILAIPFLIGLLLAGMGTTIAVGIGRPDFQMKAGGGQAILNIILSIILVIKIGFVGVLLGTLISYILSTVYLAMKIHRYLKLSLVLLIKELLKPLIISSILGSFIYLTNFGFYYYFTLSRFSNLMLFISEAAIFFVSYFLLLSKTGSIDDRSRSLLKYILLLKPLRR